VLARVRTAASIGQVSHVVMRSGMHRGASVYDNKHVWASVSGSCVKGMRH
jgi:hypothetical protein